MNRIAFIIAAVVGTVIASSASAQTIITQAKALAGNITPGDTAGYPITISTSGAYRLDSNLTVSPNTYGIYVTTNNVDIDMNGFTLSGDTTANWGVNSSNGESRIHDGMISRFRYSGMYLRGSSWVVDNVQITRNGTMGIDATGARYLDVRNSVVISNGQFGIQAGDSTSVRNGTVSKNGLSGILCTLNCNVQGNTVEGNTLFGVQATTGGLISNIVMSNGNYGFIDAGVSAADVGLGQNVFSGNNGGGAQKNGGVSLMPNVCGLAAC